MKIKVLITGTTGFVGFSLKKHLKDGLRYDVVSVDRTGIASLSERQYIVGDINSSTDYSQAIEGVQVVIHLAAKTPDTESNNIQSLVQYETVNVDGTLSLARQAAAVGVKRFIFISSIKVNGEGTFPGKPYTPFDQVNASDPYGISKAKAEQGLKDLAAETGMELVIIRPPLVYGPGVKANFAAMLKLAKKNLPLPLGAIHNRRSMVALDNLVDLIVTCIDHPKATNQTFLVSDDQDVSTTELLQMMTRATGKRPVLIPVPMSWLRLAGKLTGKTAVIDRLCGNLQVDISYTKQTLGWKPPITVEEGIRRCF